MSTVILAFLLLQQIIPPQTGVRVTGRVNLEPGQTMTYMEFDLIGGDTSTRRTKVNLAPNGSFDVAGLAPGTYEVYLLGRVVSAFQSAGRDITNLNISPKPPRPEFRVVSGRVNGAAPTGVSTSLEFDLVGGDPSTRRTKVNLTPNGSFEVLGLPPGAYEVYFTGRVISALQLADRDVTGLVVAVR